jgi:hypothetical protein
VPWELRMKMGNATVLLATSNDIIDIARVSSEHIRWRGEASLDVRYVKDKEPTDTDVEEFAEQVIKGLGVSKEALGYATLAKEESLLAKELLQAQKLMKSRLFPKGLVSGYDAGEAEQHKSQEVRAKLYVWQDTHLISKAFVHSQDTWRGLLVVTAPTPQQHTLMGQSESDVVMLGKRRLKDVVEAHRHDVAPGTFKELELVLP